MLKTIGLLSILPMLSLAFFIPYPVYVQEENKDNTTISFESNYFQVNNTEEKICPFIEFVDKELCNTTTTTTKDFNKLNLELQHIMNDVVQYNKVDCKVLYEIITYLRNNHI